MHTEKAGKKQIKKIPEDLRMPRAWSQTAVRHSRLQTGGSITVRKKSSYTL